MAGLEGFVFLLHSHWDKVWMAQPTADFVTTTNYYLFLARLPNSWYPALLYLRALQVKQWQLNPLITYYSWSWTGLMDHQIFHQENIDCQPPPLGQCSHPSALPSSLPDICQALWRHRMEFHPFFHYTGSIHCSSTSNQNEIRHLISLMQFGWSSMLGGCK